MTNEQKNATRAATQAAIAAGALVKQPCEVCGSVNVHAHHVDYSDPLNIKWLCQRHHIEEHRRLGTLGRPPRNGEKSDARVFLRLTSEERQEFERRAAACGRTLSDWIRDCVNAVTG